MASIINRVIRSLHRRNTSQRKFHRAVMATCGRIHDIHPLERRIFLSFNSSISALPTGASGEAYTVNLSTTGGAASQWVVNWGDGTTASTYFAANQPGGAFATQFTVQHSYDIPGSYVVTGSAFQAGNPTPATTAMGLGADFGSAPTPFSGQTALNPYGNIGSSSPVFISVDSTGRAGPIEKGFIYVASQFNTNRIAVTRFFGPSQFGVLGGTLDTSFGTNGTMALPAFFPSGSSEVDRPTAISVDYSDDDRPNIGVIGVANFISGGTQHSSWVAADVLATSGFFSGGSTLSWQSTSAQGLPTTGQPNAILFDPALTTPGGGSPESDLILAGTDGTHMVALALTNDDLAGSGGVLDTAAFGTNGITRITVTGAASASASAIMLSSDSTDTNDLYLGGNATFTATNSKGAAYTASAFTLARLSPNGVLDSTFHNGTINGAASNIVVTNFGSIITGSSANSSFDSVCTLLQWNDTGTTNNPDPWYITAVGTTTASGNERFALARYNEVDGSLATGFGSVTDSGAGIGLSIGPAGHAYSAILQANGSAANESIVTSASDPDSKILVIGTTASSFTIARFTNDTITGGNLDTTFGNGGVRTINFGTASAASIDVARTVGLEFDSSENVTDIIVGGETSLNAGPSQIALADILPSNSITIAQGTRLHPSVTISGASTASVGTGAYRLYLQKGRDTSLSSWTVNWGDGTAATTLSGSPPSVTHTFASAGSYNVTASYADGFGTFAATTLLPDGKYGTGGIAVTTQAGASVMTIDSNGDSLVADASGNNIRLRRYTTTGVLDTTFGIEGTATATIGSSLQVTAITIANNGDIVVGGDFNGQFVLAEFTNAGNLSTGLNAGSLDASFGTNGIVIQPIGIGTDTLSVLKIDSTGQILAGGSLSNTSAIVARFSATGVLDQSFNGGSGFISEPAVAPDFMLGVSDIMIQSTSDDIVTADTVFSQDPGFLFVYNADGTNTTFPSPGSHAIDLSALGPGGNERIWTQGYGGPYELAQETDGSFLLVGGEPYSGTMIVTHFSPQGQFDTAFGSNSGLDYTGRYNAALPTIHSVVMQSNNSFIVAGAGDNSVVRYNSDGSLDPTFGLVGSGIGLNVAGNTQAFLTSAGQLLVGGTDGSSKFNIQSVILPTYVPVTAGRLFTLAGASTTTSQTSYTLSLGSNNTNSATSSTWVVNWGDGSSNNTYTVTPTGGNPVNVTHNYSGNPHAYTITVTAVDSSGPQQTLTKNITMVAPFTIGGAFSNTHGTNYLLHLQHGQDTGITGWSVNWGDGTAVQNIAGSATTASHKYATAGQYNISAAVTDGVGTFSATTTAMDSSFGAAGKTSPALNGSGITYVEPDGSILVASSYASNFTVSHFFADGTRDFNFGSRGIASVPLGTSATAYALTMLHNGDIVVGGSAYPNFVIAAFNSSGQVDTTFGIAGNGTISTRVGTGIDYFSAFAVDAQGNLLAGGAANYTDAAIYRYSPAGKLDTSFNGTGSIIQAAPASSGLSIGVSALAIQPDGSILSADNAFSDDPGFLYRYTPTGNTDNTFGTSGETQLDVYAPSYGGPYYDMALQSDGKIVVMGTFRGGFSVALTRYTTNGALDTTYGVAGIASVNVSNNNGNTNLNIAIQPDNSVLVANDGYVQRYNVAGQQDHTFGVTGTIASNLPAANQLFLLPSGGFLVAGVDTSGSFSLEKYLTLGSLLLNVQ